MPKYTVSLEVAGYCRGYKVYEIEADNKEEAEKMYYEGTIIENEIVRDDREGEVVSVDEIKEEVKETT